MPGVINVQCHKAQENKNKNKICLSHQLVLTPTNILMCLIPEFLIEYTNIFEKKPFPVELFHNLLFTLMLYFIFF